VDQHLSRSFARGVGIGRSQNTGLKQIVVVVLHLTIDLVGGDVNETADADLLGALEQNMSAVDICVGKPVRVAEA
jgi:hypothetical protein